MHQMLLGDVFGTFSRVGVPGRTPAVRLPTCSSRDTVTFLGVYHMNNNIENTWCHTIPTLEAMASKKHAARMFLKQLLHSTTTETSVHCGE